MTAPTTLTDTFITIVVPLRDAADYVEAAVNEIDRVVRTSFRHYEILLVDDASTDNTVELIEALQRKVENIQLYCLSRRSGLDVALVAGLDASIGDYVITLNVQTDPAELIGSLWRMAQQGHPVVCGVRTAQQAGMHSWAERRFYSLYEAATGIRVPPGISDLRLYSRQVITYITQNKNRHLLLRVLPFFTSRRVATLEYQPIGRGRGFGRRGSSSAFFSGITILLGSSSLPLRLLTTLAVTASSLSLLFILYVVAVAFLKTDVVPGWISVALPMGVMFFFLTTMLGILSEYIYVMAQESGNRPVYSIARESTSSVLQIQQKLNVIDGAGDFVNLSASLGSGQAGTAQSEKERIGSPNGSVRV